MRQKIIAAAIALTLGSFAAVGAFASQDAVNLRSATGLLSGGVLGADVAPDHSANAEPTSTETPDATETATVEPTGTGTPAATSTETPEADDDADEADDADDEGDGEHGDVHGIPASNPNHDEDDGDDVCEKGETAVNTTPSGTQVNVPCQAAGEHGHGNDHEDSSDDTPESGDDSDDGEDQED